MPDKTATAGPDPIPRDLQATREALYRSLFEHAPLEVHMWRVERDAQGAITDWRLLDANPAALRAWGRGLEQAVGRCAEDIFPGSNAVATFLPLVRQIMDSGRPAQWETPFDGTGQTLRMVSIPVGDCFISAGFDVTQERERQHALELALQRVTQATRAGGVGLWDWDLRSNQVRYSDEWKRQLGHEPHEVGDDFDEWRSRVHPDDLEPTLAQARAAIENPAQPYDAVFRMRHKDGSYRWILAQSSIVLDEAGRVHRLVGSHIDVTEQRRMEERVREAQKLEALGTLAAGIAHDFNNLLTALTGNLSLLRELPPGAPEAPALLATLDDATRRATGLSKQLLTFAKGGAPVRDLASIRELILDSASFVARGSGARCEFDLAEDLAAVHADLGQLSQVIGNLVLNAIQAMPEGGTVRIGAANAVLGPGDGMGLPAGRCVRLTVADTGSGIPPQLLRRIFDPFFTTKAQGSGLGLSSCHSIVRQHGGCIDVESTPGVGSRFTVLLPAADAPCAPPAPAPDAPPPQGRGRRVLVMDDDDTIRIVVQRMLERLGYEAEGCAHGEEALARYTRAQQAARPFDAVILDLTVPGHLGGAQVMPRLLGLDPGVVAIVASGYADADILARHQEHGFSGRLLKPFDLRALGHELARVLPGAGRRA